MFDAAEPMEKTVCVSSPYSKCVRRSRRKVNGFAGLFAASWSSCPEEATFGKYPSIHGACRVYPVRRLDRETRKHSKSSRSRGTSA